MKNDFSLFGKDLFGDPVKQLGGIMNNRYIFPPFSVLDGRQKNWLDRKRAWVSLGIQSELGRDGKVKKSVINGRTNCSPEILKKFESAGLRISIFDPVLCEIAYTWFCPPGGQIVDPFAGGSVRGIVSSVLGYKYWGCDLSAAQIEANKVQAKEICPDNLPIWVNGDSREKVKKAPGADFIFSCPPYADLEVYSNDPRDLSNMEYPDFLDGYKTVISNCFDRLKDNRFACFVVGEVRDKKGYYRGFVADTINIFRECGFRLYNEVILINPTGSLSIRAGAPFDSSRKIGKTHQNVLVFVKGNPKKATKVINKNEEES